VAPLRCDTLTGRSGWVSLPAMAPETPHGSTEHGVVPNGDGWFVPGSSRGSYASRSTASTRPRRSLSLTSASERIRGNPGQAYWEQHIRASASLTFMTTGAGGAERGPVPPKEEPQHLSSPQPR
jgi:hypothetical protein